MINPKDVSIVVQGGINKTLTPICLESIRKILPGAQIVLSTWAGSDVDNLDYDILVLNDDPGAEIVDSVNNRLNNVNRQIVSTKNGILKSTGKYVLKVRSDIKLTGTGFIKIFDKYPKRSDINKIFKHRIIINNFYSANPRKTDFLYHMSDWVSFGLKEDMLDLWDIPLQDTDEQLFYKTHKRPSDFPNNNWYMKFIPEQYIMMSWLKKNGVNINIEHCGDKNDIDLNTSESSFANNFIIMNYEAFGIKFMKFNPYKHSKEVQYSYNDWQNLYKKYCDNNFVVYPDYREKINRHINNFIKPIKKFIRWIFEPLSIIFYTYKILYDIIRNKTY